MSEQTTADALRAAAAHLRERAGRAASGPWEKTDCEGELAVLAATALPRWNEAGTGYSLPASYHPEHLVLEHDLETWDEGEHAQDDVQRANAEWIALLHPGAAEPLARWLETQADDDPGGALDEAAVGFARFVLAGGQR